MNEQQFKTYLESQELWRREEEQKRNEKDYLNDLVSNMVKTDGGNLDEFRRWSTRVKSNAALLQNNGAAVQLMLRTTLGSLKDEIDRYILEFVSLNPGKSRLEVPCLDLLKYLQKAFLPSNDIDHIRETMEALRQRSGETLKVFNRKYRDLAELAYPLELRTEDQRKLLIKNYIRSLASRDIARSVLRSSPTSLQEAMVTALDGDEVEDALQRLGHRVEEPMDISAIIPKQTASLEGLSRQIEKLSTKIAKVEIQIQQGGSRRGNRRSDNRSGRTADGKPICFYCNTAGHISRQCPRKVPRGSNIPMDVSSVPPTAGQNQENF